MCVCVCVIDMYRIVCLYIYMYISNYQLIIKCYQTNEGETILSYNLLHLVATLLIIFKCVI